MAFVYYYPPAIYPNATYLEETFPDHHHAMREARQKVGHALHDIFLGERPDMNVPRIDVRETEEKYYIDVEVPGLNSVKDVEIKWSNPRMVLIKGKTKPPAIPEDVASQTGKEQKAEKDADPVEKLAENPNVVHLIKSERHHGSFGRILEFGAAVDPDTLKAALDHGLLRLVIKKRPHEPMDKKQVRIEYGTKEGDDFCVMGLPHM